MTPVTDPNILAQLNGGGGGAPVPVTDPKILAQLNGEPQQIGYGEDMAKSGGSGLLQGAYDFGPGLVGTTVNALAAGPQYLGRGIADTVEGNPTDRNFQPWQPFMTSKDILPQEVQHQPQTMPGEIMNFLGQLLGGGATHMAAGSKPVQALMNDQTSGSPLPNNQPNSGEFLGNNQSGSFPTPPAPSAGAGAQEKLQVALEGAQQQTRFSGRPNALEAGQNANEAISHQYGIDKSLQQQHYDDLNTIGSSFSMPANEVYGKGNQLISSLKDQIAPESYENKAVGDLQDIMDSLQSRYGKAEIPDKTAQLPSWKQPMVIQKGEPGQEAYGMQPSDAVDIKTTLNQLARSGRFTNSGQARILEFKNYIQGFLDKASNLSPEFGAQLDKAESQAARVGMYRDPKLSGLWQPKPDYMSYKGETETPAATFDRQANFMSKLNAGSPAAGESYSLAQILPHEQAQEIFRNALLQNKQAPEGIWQNLKTLGGATRWAGASPDSPLLTLADQLKNMK